MTVLAQFSEGVCCLPIGEAGHGEEVHCSSCHVPSDAQTAIDDIDNSLDGALSLRLCKRTSHSLQTSDLWFCS